MSINLLRRALYYMTRESQQHVMKMVGALTEVEQICIALKALLSLSPVGIGTLRTWIADGTSVSWGYERLYQRFKDDSIFELAAFFSWLVRKGVDPDDFLASCRLLGITECKYASPHLKDLPDNPVLLSRPYN